MQEVTPKSIQTRLTDLAKENRPLVLADTFARERESGENLPVLDLCNEQEGSTEKSPDPLIQGLSPIDVSERLDDASSTL
jgi:hypothetical protein